MRHLFTLCLALTACGDPHKLPTAAGSIDSPVPTHTTRDESEGVLPDSIATVVERIDHLSPSQHDQAVRSLRFLTLNCPYTRAAMQLPYVLVNEMTDVDPTVFDEPTAAEWRALQHDVDRHTGVLETLDVTLPVPDTTDGLYAGLGYMHNAGTLSGAPDRLALTHAFIDVVPDLALDTPVDRRAQIEDHSARVEQATGIIRQCPRGPWSVMPGHPWTLGTQLGTWHDALRTLQSKVDDPPANEKIAAMIALLDAYEEATHAHVGAP